jgi:hypothetical protein
LFSKTAVKQTDFLNSINWLSNQCYQHQGLYYLRFYRYPPPTYYPICRPMSAAVLPTSKPLGPGLVPGRGCPRAWQAWLGAPYARNSVDLVVTGIDRDRRAPERNLSGFSVPSIHICTPCLRFLVWTLLSTMTTFQPHSVLRRWASA